MTDVYLERGEKRTFAVAVDRPGIEAVRRCAWHWLDHAWEIEDRSS